MINFVSPHYSSSQRIDLAVKFAPRFTVRPQKEREMCLIEKEMAEMHSVFLQATERMKLVDVLGAKQFSDSERIITQVRRLSPYS